MTTTASKKAQPRCTSELQKEGVKHEYHPYPGDHSLTYFLSHFAEVMEFHSRAFGLLPQPEIVSTCCKLTGACIGSRRDCP